MRLRTCLGLLLLALGGCAHLPGSLVLDVDGNIIEFKKKPGEEPPAEPEPAAADEPAPQARDVG